MLLVDWHRLPQVSLAKVAMLSALGLPTLLAFNTGPLPSLYNQVIALIVWGGIAWAILTKSFVSTGNDVAALGAFHASMAVLAICASASRMLTALPTGTTVICVSFYGAAALGGTAGFVASCKSLRTAPADWTLNFIWAVLLAASLNCVPAIVQTLRPDLIDGTWLASPWSADRISGNLRQPNLLATLCVWGLAAAATLFELRRLPQLVAAFASLALIATIAATGSRVGAAELVGLAFWSLIDKRLRATTRKCLLLAPIILLAFWLLLQWWSQATGVLHGRAAKLSSGRYAVWRQCLEMVAAHPWFGVGFGNFNFAWTLTPFDRTNPETFDHTHNLILHWAVELGLPITLLLLALLGRSLWQCLRLALKATGDESTVRRFCLVFIATALLHSMTEYPLWYAYFLLPVCFAWGIAAAPCQQTEARRVAATASAQRPEQARPPTGWLGTCGLLMALGAAFAVYDYQKIVTIYHPFDGAPPIEARVADGRKAVLYSDLADRFAGTLAPAGSRTLEPYKTATRRLLDMRLLIAWSLAMKESGQLDKARYLAQRVKDFNDPVALQFFAACSATPISAGQPWHCLAPTGYYTYRDFL